VEIGLDPAQFWRLTPRLARITVEARLRGLEREHNERAWAAWHIAALQRCRPRDFPKLERMLQRRPVRPRGERQPSAEFWGILRAAVIAAGGKVVRAAPPPGPDAQP
jgi:hypothetical protein